METVWLLGTDSEAVIDLLNQVCWVVSCSSAFFCFLFLVGVCDFFFSSLVSVKSFFFLFQLTADVFHIFIKYIPGIYMQ